LANGNAALLHRWRAAKTIDGNNTPTAGIGQESLNSIQADVYSVASMNRQSHPQRLGAERQPSNARNGLGWRNPLPASARWQKGTIRGDRQKRMSSPEIEVPIVGQSCDS
jgi:hypothetical protein